MPQIPTEPAFDIIWKKTFLQFEKTEEEDHKLHENYLRICKEHQVLYAENLAHQGDWLFYRFFCTLIETLFPDKNAEIIDWGGLYGHITLLLKNRGYHHVHNYLLNDERYQKMVAPFYTHFQKAFHIPTLYGEKPDIFNLEDERYDIFISSGVLEHVRDEGETTEEKVLQEVFRVLKPGGAFLIWNLPCIYSLSEGLAEMTGKWHHTYRYHRNDITTLLRNAGFNISVCKAHKFLPGSGFKFFSRSFQPEKLLRFDDTLSQIFPFSCLARDFFIIARKP